jgi:hypothetical protein
MPNRKSAANVYTYNEDVYEDMLFEDEVSQQHQRTVLKNVE